MIDVVMECPTGMQLLSWGEIIRAYALSPVVLIGVAFGYWLTGLFLNGDIRNLEISIAQSEESIRVLRNVR